MIQVENEYTGASGAVKKVTGIEVVGGVVKFISYVITRRGSGKGRHDPVGTVGRSTVSAFTKWAKI